MAPPDPALLATALARAYPSPLTIGELARVSGGASRETWLFDATDAHGTLYRLVLRRDPITLTGGTDRATEFRLLAAAARAGVPVPAVRLLLDDSDGLGSGFVMDRIDGETIARKILRDHEYATARPAMTRQCGTILAAIHSVAPSDLPELPVSDAATQIRQWRSALDGFGEPHTAFEIGLCRLEAEAAALEAPQLVHGDFRNGNFIVGPEGIRSVLDWELAHLGDPIEDLGWLCARAWRFGATRQVVGGFGDIDDLLDAYERAGGRRPSLDELRFWTALATIKWGVICMAQAFTHLNGLSRSVELAAIGRRVAETEWDLMLLLDGGW
jgi:aminoglycoside phosphotransferase (APT) family kinase protein